jgi:hypothetical protein
MNPYDYLATRGKCKAWAEELVARYPDLRLVRGHYLCPIWGKQAHWWAEDAAGRVIDPTRHQFPSGGIGVYIEFDGLCACEECGKQIPEADARVDGNGHHVYCSYACNMKAVL